MSLIDAMQRCAFIISFTKSSFSIIILLTILYYASMQLNHRDRPLAASKQLLCSVTINLNQSYPTLRLTQKMSEELASEPKNFCPLTILRTNSELCSKDSAPDVLFIIHSSVKNLERRNRMRLEYFNEYFLEKYKAKVLFIIGNSTDDQMSTEIANESKHFRDIHQVELIENYHSITQKARSWVSYVDECCGSRLQYVIKMDDDVLMDNEAVMRLLKKFPSGKNSILCRTFTSNVVARHPKSKWYLSYKEYAGKTLSMYCQGMAYILSGDLIPRMHSNIQNVQYLWMDDWYVTHALMNATGVIYHDIGTHYLSVNSEREIDQIIQPNHKRSIIFAHFRPPQSFNETRRKQIWDAVRHTDCIEP